MVRYASIFAKTYGTLVRNALFVIVRVWSWYGKPFLQWYGYGPLVRCLNLPTKLTKRTVPIWYGTFYVQRAAVNKGSRNRTRRAHRLGQGWENYGPRAKSGPPKRFIRPTCAC